MGAIDNDLQAVEAGAAWKGILDVFDVTALGVRQALRTSKFVRRRKIVLRTRRHPVLDGKLDRVR